MRHNKSIAGSMLILSVVSAVYADPARLFVNSQDHEHSVMAKEPVPTLAPVTPIEPVSQTVYVPTETERALTDIVVILGKQDTRLTQIEDQLHNLREPKEVKATVAPPSYKAVEQAAPQVWWVSTIDEGLAESKEKNLPLYIHWTGNTADSMSDVLHHPDMCDMLNKRFIAVQVNADQNPRDAQEWDVKWTPSDYKMSAGSKTYLRHQGQWDTNELRRWLLEGTPKAEATVPTTSVVYVMRPQRQVFYDMGLDSSCAGGCSNCSMGSCSNGECGMSGCGSMMVGSGYSRSYYGGGYFSSGGSCANGMCGR